MKYWIFSLMIVISVFAFGFVGMGEAGNSNNPSRVQALGLGDGSSAENAIEIDLNTVSGDGVGYTYAVVGSNEWYRITLNQNNGYYKIIGDGQSIKKAIRTANGVTLNVTIEDVNMFIPSPWGSYPIMVGNNTTMNLTIIGDNCFKGRGNYAGIYIESNATLEITSQSTGKITVTSDVGNAESFENHGTLKVSGGTLTAILCGTNKTNITGTVVLNGGVIYTVNNDLSKGAFSNDDYQNGNGIVFIDNVGTVYGNVILDEDVVIPEGGTLNLASGATLVIRKAGNTNPNFVALTAVNTPYTGIAKASYFSLAANYSWDEDYSGIAEVGTYTLYYSYASQNIEYKDVNGASVTLTITKATLTVPTVPTLTAKEGQILADVVSQLPAGFAFEAATSTSVGAVGVNTFKLTYTPTDTANYNTVTNISVNITVSALPKNFPWWGWLLISLGIVSLAGGVTLLVIRLKQKKEEEGKNITVKLND